jgi:hypothetical protein
VVWCGVVWCGVVWCGVVWCGVVWILLMKWNVRVCQVASTSMTLLLNELDGTSNGTKQYLQGLRKSVQLQSLATFERVLVVRNPFRYGMLATTVHSRACG